MGKHAIIVIKNKKDEYLQYFDERWNSYLFLNCKLNDNFDDNTIKKYVADTLKLDESDISCKFITNKVHTKFSESAKKIKEYDHYFYSVEINKLENLKTENANFSWYSFDRLLTDERIQKVNSDIVGFIKDMGL